MIFLEEELSSVYTVKDIEEMGEKNEKTTKY